MRALDTLGCLLALVIACTQRASEPAIAQPAPAPPAQPAPAAPAQVAEPPAPAVEPPIDHPRVPAQAKPSKPHATSAKPVQAKPSAAPAAPAPEPEPSPVAAEPVAPAAPPSPKPATRVSVPNSEHVRVEVPPGLQAWLDKDTRMQPWLAKVMNVIDGCYAGVRADNPSATGTITFRVTMHENARPDPDIQSLPGPLSGVVACATGQLMRTRMPLFTGREGDSYVVHVKFQ